MFIIINEPKMCDTTKWLTDPPSWNEEELKILNHPIIKTPTKPTTINNIIKKSHEFPIKLPIDTIKCETIIKSVPNEILESNIQSAYPIIHENILNLCAKFLIFKKTHGTSSEKNIYEKMSVLEFIQRLLDKRAVSFSSNNYVLRNGVHGDFKWNVGTDEEKFLLKLKDYLSYDEIKISSMMSISSYSVFINNGCRYNNGIPEENKKNIEAEGIAIGISGPKLDKPNILDFEEIILTNTQNTAINGYGNCIVPTIRSLFFNFYEEESHLYNNVRYGPIKNLTHFKELNSGDIFYNNVYVKRLAISFDTLLLEANYRASVCQKFAYVHVVGIGLGIRRIEEHQEDLFVRTFGETLKKLGPSLYNISDVNFSHFHRTVHCLGVKDGHLFPIDGHPNEGIVIHISIREPFEKLDDPDKLLVVSYAADGNSLPGNEFWKGCLFSSGHAATASSSQIAELHNPFINATVCANNLMVASINGVVSISEYIQSLNNNNSIN